MIKSVNTTLNIEKKFFLTYYKMSGPSQSVNFLPPSYIQNFSTGFQSQLNSLSGSVNTLNGQVGGLGASTLSSSGGLLNMNNRDVRNFNLNSFLNNFSAGLVGSNQFDIVVDDFGGLRIVTKATKSAGANVSYTGTASIDVAGRTTINCANIQSGWYLNVFLHCMLNPIDMGEQIMNMKDYRQIFSYTNPQTAATQAQVNSTNLYKAYLKQQIYQAEINNKLPPIIMSIFRAIADAANDAISVLPSQFLVNFPPASEPITIYDAAFYCFERVDRLSVGFRGGDAEFIGFEAFINWANNYGPVPSTDLGTPSASAPITASSYISLGRDMISDGKGVSIGSGHLSAIGIQALYPVTMNCEGENLTFFTWGNIQPWPQFNFKNNKVDASALTVGYGQALNLPFVKLVPASLSNGLTGTQYYVGNEIKTFDWIGPFTYKSINTNGYQTGVNSFTTVSIPTTIYGPIYKMDTIAGIAYCFYHTPVEDFMRVFETYFKKTIFSQTSTDVSKRLNEYQSFSNISQDCSSLDSDGLLFGINGQDFHVYPPAVFSRIETTMFNPVSTGTINYFNMQNRDSSTTYNFVDGSDPHVAGVLTVGDTQLGRSDYGTTTLYNTQPNVLTTKVVQHSNTSYTDLAPDMDVDLLKVANQQNIHPQVLMNLIGTGASLNPDYVGPMEASRVLDQLNYIAAMRQIFAYQPLVTKAKWNYYQVMNRCGLIQQTSTGSMVLTSSGVNINNWINPPKMTTASALSIDGDKTAVNLKNFLPTIADDLATYFTSNAPDFNKAYLAPFNTGSYAGTSLVATTGTMTFAANVLKNWDYTYSLTSTGALLANAMWLRVQARYTNLFAYAVTGVYQANNSLFAPLLNAGYPFRSLANGWEITPLLFFNSIAPTGSQFTFDMALPNFTFNASSGTWVKSRELTVSDKYTIFRNRLMYPQGADPNKTFIWGTGSIGIPSSLFPCSTIRELFADALVAAVADINLMSTSYDVTFVNSVLTLNVVTSSASTIEAKLTRPWGHVHTYMYPHDYDASGNYRLYPVPFGQSTILYGGTNELRHQAPQSLAVGLRGISWPNYSVTGSFANPAAVNSHSTSNIINSFSRILTRQGYSMELGGSINMKQAVVNNAGVMSYTYRDFHGFEPLTSQTYLSGLYYLQNDVFPGTLPVIYTMTGSAGYNRSAAITGLKVKAPSVNIQF